MIGSVMFRDSKTVLNGMFRSLEFPQRVEIMQLMLEKGFFIKCVVTMEKGVRNMKKVFLGGTCNNSTWRDDLIPFLIAHKIDFFNPVVDDWTPDCQGEEYRQKEICNFHLYVITKEMTGVFSIAEAVDSAHDKNKWCLFQIIPDGFDKGQYKSLMAVAELIQKRGGWAYIGDNFDGILHILKNKKV